MSSSKRKKKSDVEKRQVIVEPVRRSILDVINTNLKIANRVTFLHRLIYVGQYSFTGNDNIVSAMEDNYKTCNTGYTPEPLSGIMLYYERYFCYIAEAPESVLNKHLSALFAKYGDNLSHVKLLAAVHHIKGRFWNEWMSYYGRPPQRVEEINPESDLETSMWYVKECCQKLYKFANAYISAQQKLRKQYISPKEFDEEDEDNEEIPELSASQRSKSVIAARDTYSEFLPERKLLDFLVNCQHLQDLKQYQNYYKYIGQSMDFSRKGWPAPTTMIPYNVFDTPYDPIEDLPTVQRESSEVEKEDTEIPDNLEPPDKQE